MAPKSFGVEKWSAPGRTTRRASGRASTRGAPGPAKSRAPMTTSTEALTLAHASAVRRRRGAWRQPVGQIPLEGGGGGRAVGPLGGAVAEDVDRHGLPAGVGQQVEPAVLAPGAGRRGGEAVEEDDGGRRGHLGRLAYLGTFAYLKLEAGSGHEPPSSYPPVRRRRRGPGGDVAGSPPVVGRAGGPDGRHPLRADRRAPDRRGAARRVHRRRAGDADAVHELLPHRRPGRPRLRGRAFRQPRQRPDAPP